MARTPRWRAEFSREKVREVNVTAKVGAGIGSGPDFHGQPSAADVEVDASRIRAQHLAYRIGGGRDRPA
jgi:hypothetical protein